MNIYHDNRRVMSDEDRIHELVAAIEDGDEATIREILADEITHIGSDESFPQDRVVESMLNLHDALAGMEYTVEDLWHDDGTNVLHLDLEGSFEQPLEIQHAPGADPVTVEPNGDEIAGSFVYLLRFGDDGLDAMASFDDSQAMLGMGVLEYTSGVEAAMEADD